MDPTGVSFPEDFASGDSQLARAIVLWHLSAMEGNVESALALGYRHFYSATGGVSNWRDQDQTQLLTTAQITSDTIALE